MVHERQLVQVASRHAADSDVVRLEVPGQGDLLEGVGDQNSAPSFHVGVDSSLS